ncbi:MAG: amidohydrolase family protein [Clostridiales bacterium]|jgi:predicted TIM-barrel fold metal-dependent hydrolase|nr:amidohydrolase family protein [Clostridiales bacterium]
MPIIDAHAHIYPDKIALKAAMGVGAFYGLPMRHDGTVSRLLETGKKAGIHKFLVHSVATSPAQVQSINNFIANTVLAHAEFIGFATAHQDLENMERELERAFALGLRGVKLHPDFQRFRIDDPKLDRLYAFLEGRYPLLLHAGDDRYDFSGPARIANIVKRFPKLDVICAHLGGYTEWDAAGRLLAGRRLWVDTSSSLHFMSVEKARGLIEAYGEDRVIFGTDYPMWDAAEEMERFDKLNLTEAARGKILYKNICGLLNLML